MKIIIAGSRGITSANLVYQAIEQSGFKFDEVVSGGAAGVDELGEDWAETSNIPVKVFPANWYKHGKAAGPLRNQTMACYADALVAVWDGESLGTYNMILEMQYRNKPVKVFLVDENKLNELKASI